jgi:hypothetical protein
VRRALVLAYYFPPIGGAGAQRPAKLVRYLPTFGVEPVVVTGSGAAIGRWTPADETLNAEVAPSTEVHRVGGKEPVSAVGWRSRGERWFGVRPKWSSWWVNGVVDLGRHVRDVDLIYSWMSPYESAVAAARLSEELGKPWVADLGDPWALDEMMMFPSALHRRRELRRMRRLLGSAAAIVMSTPEATLRVRQAFPELAGKPIVSIPNGFDASDFEGPVPARDDGVFRIVHTGYLHTELGTRQRRTAALRRVLGGETSGVDILTRSHVYLLEAIDCLIEQDPSLRDRIEVHLAGVLSSTDREIAGRSEVVRLHGYLPHAESIQLIRSADLLFLPMQNLPRGTRSSTVPGKTYEYIGSGRPILAAIPDGDAHDILSAVGTARFTAPADSTAMADAIEAEVNRWRCGGEAPQAAWDVVARYERQLITEELAAVFDAVTALPTTGRSRTSGAADLALRAR